MLIIVIIYIFQSGALHMYLCGFKAQIIVKELKVILTSFPKCCLLEPLLPPSLDLL